MAIKEKKELATITNDDNLPDYIKIGGEARGSEDVGMEDLAIPRLEIIQALSPCRKKTDPSYIDGAEEKQLYNNVTREMYGESVLVVPVTFKKQYLVWKDRDSGGGFRGDFNDAESANQQIVSLVNSGDNGPFEAVDTAQHICLLVRPNGKTEEIAISMSRSKLKVSRQWNSMIRLFEGDRFSRMYVISAVDDKGEKGEFYNFQVKPAGFPSKEVYLRAEQLYNDIHSGDRDINVNHDTDQETPMQDGTDF